MPTIAGTSTRTATGQIIIRNNLHGLIQEAVSPKVPVGKKTQKYYKYDNSHFRLENDEYTTRGGSTEINRNYSTANLDIKGYAFKEWIDGDVLDDADAEIRPEIKQGAILGIKDGLKLKSEKRLADLLFTGSNFPGHTAALAGPDRWNLSTSDPIAQWKVANRAVLLDGKAPVNTVIFGYDVWNNIAYNPALLALLSDNSIKVLTPELLQKIFITNQVPVQQVLIGAAVYNAAKEGAAEDNQFIWGKSALFCNIDMSQRTVRGSTLIKTFVLKKKPVEYKFYKDADEDKEGLWGRGRLYYEHNLIDFNRGYLFTTAVD